MTDAILHFRRQMSTRQQTTIVVSPWHARQNTYGSPQRFGACDTEVMEHAAP